MANQNRIKLQAGEEWSKKYHGFIFKGGNLYRKPYIRMDKLGKERCANHYHVEVACNHCGKRFLADRSNYLRAVNTYCSADCSVSARVLPDGSKKKKRGRFKDGHILVRRSDHPHADRNGYVPEHRLVMEDSLGRLLKRSERVHHINCIKEDNRIENLVVCENHTEHFLIHGSLNRCVAELIEMGVLRFNGESGVYEVVK
jgi:hypothetical protein